MGSKVVLVLVLALAQHAAVALPTGDQKQADSSVVTNPTPVQDASHLSPPALVAPATIPGAVPSTSMEAGVVDQQAQMPSSVSTEAKVKVPEISTDLDLEASFNGVLTAVVMSYPNPRNANLTKVLLHLSKSPVYKEILLIWNSEQDPPIGNVDRVRVLKQSKNSMNNRWMLADTLKTDAMITVDDDMILAERSAKCMYSTSKRYPNRIIGGWVRGICNGKWWSGEKGSSDPSCKTGTMVENPMIVTRALLRKYASEEFSNLRSYVDSQAAHCDDVLINSVAQRATKKAPVSVAATLEHYGHSSGLFSQGARQTLRVECYNHIMANLNLPAVTPETVDCR